jgi:hypothetical protein
MAMLDLRHQLAQCPHQRDMSARCSPPKSAFHAAVFNGMSLERNHARYLQVLLVLTPVYAPNRSAVVVCVLVAYLAGHAARVSQIASLQVAQFV